MSGKSKSSKKVSKKPAGAPVPLPSNPQELEQVLAMLMTPDNAVIQQATTVMKEFLKVPACVGALMQQIQASQREESRQMAAVLLRRQIATLWIKLDKNTKDQIKACLLDRLVNEQIRACRLSVAALIASVARLTVPKKQWDNLLEFLLNLFRSADNAQREIAMMLFRALSDSIPTSLKPHFKTMQAIFITGMKDPEPKVRIEALKAISALVELIDIEDERDLNAFKETVPHVIEMLVQHIKLGDEDVVAAGFEVLEALADTPALDNHTPQLVQLMIAVLKNMEFPISVREKSSYLLSDMIKAFPLKLANAGLVPSILECAIGLILEPNEDAFQTVEQTAQKLGVEILDPILLNVPKILCYQPCLDTAVRFLSSKNKYERKTAQIIIGIMAEGCCELMFESLSTFIQYLCDGMRDPESIVRAAACTSLTQFAEYFQPEITDCHPVVLPAIFSVLSNANENLVVREKCCDALDCFCENMGEEILPYIVPLMEQLVLIVSSGVDKLQQSGISAIRSVAASAGEKFLPFFPACMNLICPFLMREEDHLLNLRCRSTVCVGYMAAAVGKEHFGPFLQETLSQVMKGMKLEFFELREASYIYFTRLAIMLGEDYVPLLKTTLVLALATCLSDDGVDFTRRADGLNADDDFDDSEGEYGSDLEDDDDIAIEEEDSRGLRLSIRSSALDEKVEAINFLANVMAIIKEPLIPYLEKIDDALDQLSEYPHHFVRGAVLNAQTEEMILLSKLYPPVKQYDRGEVVPLPEQIKTPIEKLLDMWLCRVERDDDRATAATAVEAIQECCKIFGIAPLTQYLDRLKEAIVTILEQKAPSQRPEDEDEEEDEDGAPVAAQPKLSEDHDEILMDAVTDLIAMISQVMGKSFEPLFRVFFPLIIQYQDASKQPADRSMAIGCVAEIIDGVQDGLIPHLEHIIRQTLIGLNDSHILVKRNASFAAGNLCMIPHENVYKVIPEFLTLLHRLYTPPNQASSSSPSSSSSQEQKSPGDILAPATTGDDFLGCRDNACSAIAKIIRYSPPGLVSLEQVVPVFLNGLPLVNDFSESKTVYPTIVWLYQTHLNIIGPHTPQVVSIFAQVFGNPEVDATVQKEMMNFVKALSSQMGQQQLEAIVNALPAAQKENFIKFLQAA